MNNAPRVILYFTCILFMYSSLSSCNKKGTDIVPIANRGVIAENFVPNDITAIKIAEAVWLPIYGEATYEKKPFTSILKDSIWIVEGTLPDGLKGGVPYIEIQQSDCKILKVTHSK